MVADLDENGVPELVFAYAIHTVRLRAYVAMADFTGDRPSFHRAVSMKEQVPTLSRISEAELALFVARRVPNQTRRELVELGRLTSRGLLIAPDLPSDLGPGGLSLRSHGARFPQRK